MNKSDSLSKLAPAFLKAQKQVDHATKNAQNPHLKNKYADLAEVIDTVIPVFNEAGISIIQFPGFCDGRATLTTVALHESGEFLEGTAETPIGKQDPQTLGGGITYLARYSLARVSGIAQEDDDGETAMARGSKQTKGKESAQTPQEVRDTAKAVARDPVDPGALRKALLDELEAAKATPLTPLETTAIQDKIRALHQMDKVMGLEVYGLARKAGVLE